MRSTKELLEVMLNNKKEFTAGLCLWASRLYHSDIITHEEYIELRLFIKANRPSKYSSIAAYKSRNSGYYWEDGVIKYRVEWIKKHIKIFSK